MPKESRSRMQKWPSSTLRPPNSTVTGTTHFYPVAIRSAHVICAQALSPKTPINLLHHTPESSHTQLGEKSGLGSYFRSGAYNPEQEMKLADAVKLSREEFMGQFEVLFTQIE